MEVVLPSGLVMVKSDKQSDDLGWRLPFDPKRAAVPGSHLIDVHLYRPSTGDRRVYQPEYPWVEDGESNPSFIWEEGNFGCDCNRSLFLYDWPVDDEQMLPCNTHANQIIIEKIVIRGTDTVLYSELPPG